jgi:hypothetical protein
LYPDSYREGLSKEISEGVSERVLRTFGSLDLLRSENTHLFFGQAFLYSSEQKIVPKELLGSNKKPAPPAPSESKRGNAQMKKLIIKLRLKSFK